MDDHTALLARLNKLEIEAQSRIYVYNLKRGYVIKDLFEDHQVLLDHYEDDPLDGFVGMMMNSSAPVSVYGTLSKFAPKSKKTVEESTLNLSISLSNRNCNCSLRQDNPKCMFRKLSWNQRRKMTKELTLNSID